MHRYDLSSGKEMVVLNIHNSAYDKGGFIKKQQLEYLRKLILTEYEKGNYVIAGGDWNQCPPDFQFDAFSPGQTDGYTQINIEKDFLPADWTWVYDPSVPTNRKVEEIYEEGETFTTIIDFFLLSPNVEALSVKGIDLDFASSDHQPVRMEFRLR